MATLNNKTAVKSVRQRNYLARDFDGFRTVLLDYARRYYPNRIQDFSDASLGGLFLDMAAYVGDNMSFYMDHLYGELNYDTAVETVNIERAIKNAGIEITGASPSIAEVEFYIEVPVDSTTQKADVTLLPTIQEGTTLLADNGVIFTLLDNVKFWKVGASGNFEVNDSNLVTVTDGRNVNGQVLTQVLSAKGLCRSGREKTETFTIGTFIPYRKLTLAEPNVTEIISVSDNYGNSYYEVKSLADDVVYKNVINTSSSDSSVVKDYLKVIPAPYRFTKDVDLATRNTTLTFGGGTASSLQDDIIPDPSEFALPLPYAQTFSRVAINPQSLLKTATLGVATENTTLTIVYRHGGGLNHSVEANTIRNLASVDLYFPSNPPAAREARIRASLEVTNPGPAVGGEDALTADDFIALIPAMKS